MYGITTYYNTILFCLLQNLRLGKNVCGLLSVKKTPLLASNHAYSTNSLKMPFWKKEKKQPSVESANGSSNGSNEDANGGDDKNGGGGEGPWVKDPKVNYKARLEHKQYLVRRAGGNRRRYDPAKPF